MPLKNHWFLPASLLCAALLYSCTRSHHPGWGDGMGFLLAASRGFDLNTNATSHFLYNNLNHFALWLFPGQNPVTVLVWLNIGYALGALWQGYHLALLVSRDAFASALMTLALAMGYTFWRQAVGIEVYACYLLVAGALLRYAVADLVRGHPPRHTLLLGLLWGLAVLVHIQAMLLLPALVVWACYTRPKTAQMLAALAVAVSLFSLLLLLPWLLHTHDLASVFAEQQFRQHLAGLDIKLLIKGLSLSVAFGVYQYHLWALPVVAGGIRLWKERRPVAVFLLTVILPVWGFASRYGVTDAYVFFLVPYVALVPVGAAGLKPWLDRIKILDYQKIMAVALVPLLAWGGYHTAAFVAEKSGKAADFQAQKAYKGGLAYYLYPGMEHVPDPLPLIRAGVHSPDSLEWAHVYWFGRAYVEESPNFVP